MMNDTEKRAKDVMKENNDILTYCRESVVVDSILKNMRNIYDSITADTDDSCKKRRNAARARTEILCGINIPAREQVLCDLEAYESKFFDLFVNNINVIDRCKCNCPDRDILLGVVECYHPGTIDSGNNMELQLEKYSQLRNSFAGIFEVVSIEDMDKRLDEYKHIHEIDSKIIELNDEVQKRPKVY